MPHRTGGRATPAYAELYSLLSEIVTGVEVQGTFESLAAEGWDVAGEHVTGGFRHGLEFDGFVEFLDG